MNFRSIAALIVLLGCLGGARAERPAPEPCQARATQPQQVLRNCTTEISRQNGELHNQIQLIWDGTGEQDMVLGLGVPAALALHVVQLRATHQAGDPTQGEPGETLLDFTPDSAASERPPAGTQLALPVRLSPGLNLIEVKARLMTFPLHLPDAHLYSVEGWREWTEQHILMAGIVLGLMLAVLIGLGTMYSLGRDRSHLAFASLTLCYVLAMLQVQGYLQPVLWPDAPGLNARVLTWIAMAMSVCHCAFASTFLQLRERLPWGHRSLVAFVVALALLALTPLIWSRGQADWLLKPMALIWILLTVLIAVSAVRMRMPGARWYAAGTASFMICFVLLFGLGGNGLNPFPEFYFFDYGKIGYLLEIGCFSAAQVQRIRGLGRQKQALRQRQLDDAQSLLSAARALNLAQADASFNRLLLASTSHDLVQPLAALRMTVSALRNQTQPDPSHFQ
ncbi:7TM-DISM domain-containing protein, partial [Ideonella sp.]|uniref:7TM-DISM domain-containing protein n=1 Tax=Ideonella sp. TaxID=1929293 RepID=UPI003BB7EE24